MSRRVYVELRRQEPGVIRGTHHVIAADGTELFQAASLMEAVKVAREAGYRVFVPVTGSCQDRRDAADWHEWK
jgi:hypothetical protein